MRKLIVTLIAFVVCEGMNGQSITIAKTYITQGKYSEAFLQLRPLADYGDTEAQFLTAKLFFEKKLNTVQGEQQGEKYAQMAAERGNEDAVKLLSQYYQEKGETEKYEQTIKRYDEYKAKYGTATIEGKPEMAAEFPGDLFAWLGKNVNYPYEAKRQGIQGRVSVQFIINTDGSIVDVKVLRSPDPSLSAEAVRVVEAMPKWKPAFQKGKPVRMRYTLPIMFRLP